MLDREARLQAAKEEIGAAFPRGVGEGRGAAILDRFRTGARRPWCRLIWKAVIQMCGGTQQAVAQRFYLSNSAVSEGASDGRLSVENLVVMQADFQPHGWKLPELPPHEELAREGFAEAMAFVREPQKPAGQRRRPTLEDLAALVALLAEKDWFRVEAEREQARLNGDAARVARLDKRLHALAMRISAAASKRSGMASERAIERPIERPIERNVEQLRQLQRSWADCWIECRRAVPFPWTDKT